MATIKIFYEDMRFFAFFTHAVVVFVGAIIRIMKFLDELVSRINDILYWRRCILLSYQIKFECIYIGFCCEQCNVTYN